SWCSFVLGEGGSGEGESCGGSGVDWRIGEMVEKWLAGKLLTAMASEQRSSGPTLNEMTPGTISLGLMPTSSPSTSYVPLSRNDWDLLFQPMFDELLNPPPSGVNQAPKAIAPIVEVIPPSPRRIRKL
nr:hypothetical protein [Tanacetum cinerariifolium]